MNRYNGIGKTKSFKASERHLDILRTGPSDSNATKSRKFEHVNVVLKRDVQYKTMTTMFEDIRLMPKSGPISTGKVDMKTRFLGKNISAPIFVSGMTGGDERVGKINYDIAEAVSELKLPMGVGSQRAMIEDKGVAHTFAVKSKYDVILLGNMGAAQVLRYSKKEIKEMLDAIDADALCIHTNPAQEIAQPEGDINFKNAFRSISGLADSLEYKIIIKEVGNGVSKDVAKMIQNTQIYGIDTGGAGGTNWVAIELFRAGNGGKYKHIFKEWGMPTAQSLLEIRSEFNRCVTATGGIRSGEDIAKAVALGADACGIAAPVIQAQGRAGSKGVTEYLNGIMKDLKQEMGRLGVRNINELSTLKYQLTGDLKNVIEQRLEGKRIAGYT